VTPSDRLTSKPTPYELGVITRSGRPFVPESVPSPSRATRKTTGKPLPRITALERYISVVVERYKASRPQSQSDFIYGFFEDLEDKDKKFGVHLQKLLVERYPAKVKKASRVHKKTRLSKAIIVTGLRWRQVDAVIRGLKRADLCWE